MFVCQACDWRGADPIAHEHQYHDGAQTCWEDRAAALRQFVREHRERLSEPESVAARRHLREWADDEAKDDDWMFDPLWDLED